MNAPARPAPIAAARHTWILLGAIALITALSARRAGGAPIHPAGGSHLALYGTLLAGQWLLFYWVWRGLKAHGTPLLSVFGGSLRTSRGRVLAVAGGLVVLGLIRLVAFAVHRGLAHLGAPVDADAAAVVEAMAPHGAIESVLWVLLSISAGVCEEFVYRGYFLRQFSAWLGSPVAGLIASALVFGLGHAYQGPWQVLLITLAYGVPYGVVAVYARSLGPTIVAHALEDILDGLLRI